MPEVSANVTSSAEPVTPQNAPRTPPRLPPLAGGAPLLGSLPALLAKQAAFFTAARAKYGDIYRLKLGPLEVVIVNRPEHAQHILRDCSAKYGKGGNLWTSVRTLLGNGLAVSEGELWLRQRRMMQPHFHHQRLGELLALIVDAIDEALTPWDAAAQRGSPLGAEHAFNPITMKVIAKALSRGDIRRDEVETVNKSMIDALDYVFRGIIAQELPAWVPVPGRRRYLQALRNIDEILFRIIERSQRRSPRAGESDNLIATLLRTVDTETGAQMTRSQVRDEAVSLFLAGYETTALGLSWSIQYLLRNPAVMARLQAEVDDALGERRPELSDLPRLSYARMVFQEALRLSPPIWYLARSAVLDDKIDGYDIPAGTMVTALPYVIHRHPDFWEEPERFDPERFTPERSTPRHKLSWIPFGAGQHQCIGRELALLEGQLILSRVVQRYTIWAPDAPRRPPTPALSMTLRLKNGAPWYLRRRGAR